jgi:hypothetical protein
LLGTGQINELENVAQTDNRTFNTTLSRDQTTDSTTFTESYSTSSSSSDTQKIPWVSMKSTPSQGMQANRSTGTHDETHLNYITARLATTQQTNKTRKSPTSKNQTSRPWTPASKQSVQTSWPFTSTPTIVEQANQTPIPQTDRRNQTTNPQWGRGVWLSSTSEPWPSTSEPWPRVPTHVKDRPVRLGANMNVTCGVRSTRLFN